MKKFILSIVGLFLFGAATVMAQNVLVIHLKDGSDRRYILLDEEPVITFTSDKIVITSERNSTELGLAMADVSYFNYDGGNGTTRIEETVVPGGMNLTGDQLALSGLPAGSDIYIYGVGGQLFMETKADDEGNAVIDLTSLNTGVYIVKANNISTKITKK